MNEVGETKPPIEVVSLGEPETSTEDERAAIRGGAERDDRMVRTVNDLRTLAGELRCAGMPQQARFFEFAADALDVVRVQVAGAECALRRKAN
jgi:hypothetical protein